MRNHSKKNKNKIFFEKALEIMIKWRKRKKVSQNATIKSDEKNVSRGLGGGRERGCNRCIFFVAIQKKTIMRKKRNLLSDCLFNLSPVQT